MRGLLQLLLVLLVVAAAHACGPDPDCTVCLNGTDTGTHSDADALLSDAVMNATATVCLQSVWGSGEVPNTMTFESPFIVDRFFIGNQQGPGINAYSLNPAFLARLSNQTSYAVATRAELSHGGRIELCDPATAVPGASCTLDVLYLFMRGTSRLTMYPTSVFRGQARAENSAEVTATDPGTGAAAGQPVILTSTTANEFRIGTSGKMFITDLAAFALCGQQSLALPSSLGKLTITATTTDVRITSDAATCGSAGLARQANAGVSISNGAVDILVAQDRVVTWDVPISATSGYPAMTVKGPGRVDFPALPSPLQHTFAGDSVYLNLEDDAMVRFGTEWNDASANYVDVVIGTGTQFELLSTGALTYGGTALALIHVEGTLVIHPGARISAPYTGTTSNLQVTGADTGKTVLEDGAVWTHFQFSEGLLLVNGTAEWTSQVPGYPVTAYNQMKRITLGSSQEPGVFTINGWDASSILILDVDYYISPTACSLLDVSNTTGTAQFPQSYIQRVYVQPGFTASHTCTLIRTNAPVNTASLSLRVWTFLFDSSYVNITAAVRGDGNDVVLDITLPGLEEEESDEEELEEELVIIEDDDDSVDDDGDDDRDGKRIQVIVTVSVSVTIGIAITLGAASMFCFKGRSLASGLGKLLSSSKA